MRNMALWTVTHQDVLENWQTFRDIFVDPDINPRPLDNETWCLEVRAASYVRHIEMTSAEAKRCTHTSSINDNRRES